jgi:hypothetical protein
MATLSGNQAQEDDILPLTLATLVSSARAISTVCLIFYFLKIIHPIKMVFRNVMSR